MGYRLLALFEVVRTLAEAGDSLPGHKLDKVIDEVSRVYSKVFMDDIALVESFAVVKESLKGRPPTDEDETVVRMASSLLDKVEVEYGLVREAEDVFYKSLEKNLGKEVASLVKMFEIAMRQAEGSNNNKVY